jgi:hypothetical protein
VQIDAYGRDHMEDGGDETGEQVSDIDKTSLRDAIEVFNTTFMNDLWRTIRYANCVSRYFTSLLPTLCMCDVLVLQERVQGQAGPEKRRAGGLLNIELLRWSCCCEYCSGGIW